MTTKKAPLKRPAEIKDRQAFSKHVFEEMGKAWFAEHEPNWGIKTTPEMQAALVVIMQGVCRLPTHLKAVDVKAMKKEIEQIAGHAKKIVGAMERIGLHNADRPPDCDDSELATQMAVAVALEAAIEEAEGLGESGPSRQVRLRWAIAHRRPRSHLTDDGLLHRKFVQRLKSFAASLDVQRMESHPKGPEKIHQTRLFQQLLTLYQNAIAGTLSVPAGASKKEALQIIDDYHHRRGKALSKFKGFVSDLLTAIPDDDVFSYFDQGIEKKIVAVLKSARLHAKSDRAARARELDEYFRRTAARSRGRSRT